MTIILNHTIVPTHDKEASARFFSEIFGLKFGGLDGHFAPVRINGTLTFDFDQSTQFESHHYAFLVGDEEFEAILGRVRQAGISFGSDPWHERNGQLNNWHGGKGFYFRDPNGHLMELLTRSGDEQS